MPRLPFASYSAQARVCALGSGSGWVRVWIEFGFALGSGLHWVRVWFGFGTWDWTLGVRLWLGIFVIIPGYHSCIIFLAGGSKEDYSFFPEIFLVCVLFIGRVE